MTLSAIRTGQRVYCVVLLCVGCCVWDEMWEVRGVHYQTAEELITGDEEKRNIHAHVAVSPSSAVQCGN